MKRRGREASGRRFRFVSRKERLLRLAASAALCCAALVCVWQLIRYAVDDRRAKDASAALRAEYYSQPASTLQPSALPAETEAPPAAAAAPSPSPQPDTLPAVRYPNNPYATVNSRFRKLRQQNGDIVGWLKIDGMLDEAVVQRDNAYYLARDYRGYHNVNGAIFLDESCALDTRPYTLILYGHNMKTGAMFGSLRHYENLRYYKANPFITFDTAYDEGEYVVFCVATVGVTPESRSSVNFALLESLSLSQREEALETLTGYSLYKTSLDVQPDDQLLLLMTCVDDDSERRVVAARRLREGENRERLEKIVQEARKK